MRPLLPATLFAVLAATAHSQLTAPPENHFPDARVEAIATKILHDTGVPSATIGIVQNGHIVYTGAFGLASIKPERPAEPSMAYPIGSISKQFTAAAVLLLQQDGKLSLTDPVSRYFPELTRSSEVTLLNLLTHTSGYQDYAPQDYTIPAWKLPGDPLKVVHEFAGKPLDFDPGTQWQYSNTNFVLAALIVQKVSGEPFAKFLRERVLQPAGLESSTPGEQPVLNLNSDQSKLRVTGYMRNALAPSRPAALEAPGWYFGDGDLAMPVGRLMQWDISIINQSLLSPASYKQMETPFLLKDGKDSHYGLGVQVLTQNGHRVIEHSGEVGGFVAENIVFPDDHAAVAVLTNQDASAAASQIARAIVPLLFTGKDGTAAPDAFAPRLQAILTGLQHGQIDRSLFTANCNDYYDRNALADYQSSLQPLGVITAVKPLETSLRGGMTFTEYNVAFSGGTSIIVTVYIMPGGKIEQLLVVGKA
jgi:CubicO group peptidase (beta-lactamase class C family)